MTSGRTRCRLWTYEHEPELWEGEDDADLAAGLERLDLERSDGRWPGPPMRMAGAAAGTPKGHPTRQGGG